MTALSETAIKGVSLVNSVPAGRLNNIVFCVLSKIDWLVRPRKPNYFIAFSELFTGLSLFRHKTKFQRLGLRSSNRLSLGCL